MTENLNQNFADMQLYCDAAHALGEDARFFYAGEDLETPEGVTVTAAPLTGPFTRRADAAKAVEDPTQEHPAARICYMEFYIK